MKINASAIIAGTVALTFLLVSCKHDPDYHADPNLPPPDDTTTTGNCDPDTVYFQNQILPVLQSSCSKSGCHDQATHMEDIILSSYGYLMQSGIVSAFNPDGSDLYEVITETDPRKLMPPPPEQPLSQEQISLIYKWIQQGALNNMCINDSCDSTNITFSGMIWPTVNMHCKGCHSGGLPGGGIRLENHAQVVSQCPEPLWGSINHISPASFMPKNGGKLTPCEIAWFKRWFELGMPDN